MIFWIWIAMLVTGAAFPPLWVLLILLIIQTAFKNHSDRMIELQEERNSMIQEAIWEKESIDDFSIGR
jgi:ABC-type bacteriocin/lantibiotic exporter with double-glycine peptidase domain